MKKPPSKLASSAGVAAACLLAGQLGLWLTPADLKASAIWPASGVALGLMLLLGRSVWPGILAGSFLVSLSAHPNAAWTFASFAALAGVAISNTLQTLAAYGLVQRFAGGRDAFQQPLTVFRFVALAAVLSTAISPTAGLVSLCLGGLSSWGTFGSTWLTWWLGYVVSVIVITPMLLVWKTEAWPRWPRSRWLEAAALTAVLTLISLAVFGDWFTSFQTGPALKFLAAPVLLWSAFRFGLRGATGSVLFLTALAIFDSLGGRPPSNLTDLRLLQAFIAIIAAMALVVAADVSQRQQAEAGRNACELRYQQLFEADLAERRRAEAALKASNENLDHLNQQLEHRVRERTAQLESVNRELEAFAFSVSHDLRAPLRSIRGFSEVVLHGYAQQLDRRGQDYLRRACESSQQMDRLIEDLLKFSRVTRAEFHWQPVDLSALAAGIAGELRLAEPERKVDFIIAPDLRARGDEHLLRIAMDNLFRNAWKFTGKRQHGRIEFGSAAETLDRSSSLRPCMAQTEDPAHTNSHNGSAQPTFFVRDDGAGFPMEHAGKLFGVFQRLHSSAEFPGTGVGLATVQRIITRHGGRIWATGMVDQGATFFFTLPGAVADSSSLSPARPTSSLFADAL